MAAANNVDSSHTEHQPDRNANRTALDLDSENFPLERYEPLSEIGRGSAGVVYVCYDRFLAKSVAIKCLRSVTAEQLMSFQQEAKATSLLKHIGVVAILDFGVTSGGAPYMVMEYADGKTLEQRIREKGPLTTSLAVKVFIRTAEALEYAHSKGIYHRDLKSSNILILDENPTNPDVRLIDFGVAGLKHAIQAATMQGMTIVGTPAYMPPDQASGLPYDASSEIYALGCTMFEGLTGRTPFVGETALEIIAMHSRSSPPTLSEIRGDIVFSAELELIIQTCLAKKKEDRFASMSDLVHALSMLDSGERSGDDTSRVPLNFVPSNGGIAVARKPKRAAIYITLVAVMLAPAAIIAFFLQPRLSQDGNETKVKMKPLSMDVYGFPSKTRLYLKPKSVHLVERAWKSLEENNPKQAHDLCSEAIIVDKNNLRALDVRALSHLLKGETTQALAELDRSILRRAVISQNEASTYFFRGLVHKKIGDATKARMDFREARVLGGYIPSEWEQKLFSIDSESWQELQDHYANEYSCGLENRGGDYKLISGNDSELSALFDRQNPPVDELYLRGGAYSGRALMKIAELPTLRGLELGGLHLADHDCEFLTRCEKLERLEITECNELTGTFLKYIGNAKRLRLVQVKGGILNDESFKYLSNLSSLRTVGVQGCPEFSGIGFSYLPGNIERVDWLSSWDKSAIPCSINYDKDRFARLNKIQNLVMLVLSSDSLNDTAYSALLEMKVLRTLVLCGKLPLRLEQLEKLKNLPNLERIEFRNLPISNEAIEKIGLCKKVQALVFSEMSMDRESMEAVFRLPQKLKGLSLPGANIDMRTLIELQKMSDLKHLTLDGLPRTITPADIATLKKSLPACEIHARYADGRSSEM